MIIGINELSGVRASEEKIILGTGTFDLFHYDHLRYLQMAKECGGALVVAIKDNKFAGRKGKARPIISEEQRIAIVDALKCVDYTFLVGVEDNLETMLEYDNDKQREWLSAFEKVFDRLRPDILFFEGNPVLQSARERASKYFGFKCVSKPRGKTISTTEIIRRISESIK